MSKQRLTDAMESTDAETRMWKSRFTAARGAYATGNFKQGEDLLAQALEQGKHLPEKDFAVNTCLVGQAANALALGDMEKARNKLNEVVRTLSSRSEPALKELHAVALRFLAEIASQKQDYDAAEQYLQEACRLLETVGVAGAVQLAYAMSDLATVYLKQGDSHDAGELVLSAMELLTTTHQSETTEYERASLLYNLCHVENEKEFLGALEDSIQKMEYRKGSKHPSIVRAVRWLVQVLRERGEEEKIAEVEEKFGVKVV
ncbi:MAG: tetratricopeptide repeat protein [Candidatus Melainabacteria bacterium]|nr:MAG: tetratricopeptide repeat protein [Candidatus Melainabacteria bacterium]